MKKNHVGLNKYFIFRKILTNSKLNILLSFTFLFSVCMGENFIVGSDIWKPFFMENNGKYQGINYEIVTEIFRRTGDTVVFQRIPNKRALTLFENSEIDIMVDSPLWNDPNKSDDYVFSTAIMNVQEYIYFLTEDKINVDTPLDLTGRTVDILRGYYYPVFEELFKSGIVQKNEVNAEASLIGKLVLRRTDAIFIDSIAFQYTINELGFDTKRFQRSMQLSNAELGIKIIRSKQKYIPRINEAIASMKRDGTIDEIIRKYTN